MMPVVLHERTDTVSQRQGNAPPAIRTLREKATYDRQPFSFNSHPQNIHYRQINLSGAHVLRSSFPPVTTERQDIGIKKGIHDQFQVNI